MRKSNFMRKLENKVAIITGEEQELVVQLL